MDFTFPFHIVWSKNSTITEVNGYRRDVQPTSGRGSISLFITIPRLGLWSIYPHMQLVLVSPSPGVNQPGHSSIHFTFIQFSSQESVDFLSVLLLYAFMIYWLGTQATLSFLPSFPFFSFPSFLCLHFYIVISHSFGDWFYLQFQMNLSHVIS